MDESTRARDAVDAVVIRSGQIAEQAKARGRYEVECRGADGALKWREIIENLVVIVGKNLALDTYLAGAGYTVTGPFMGLITATSFTGIVPEDTMTSHAGWLEAGGANAPAYTGNRKTAAWAAASAGAKALSSALAFAITSDGTVKGVFLVFGAGASATKDNTGGVLYSAGTFAAGDKVVSNGDSLNVLYTASL